MRNIFSAALLALASFSSALLAQTPAGYPQNYSDIVDAAKKAAHPNAAKLWVDYVLSKRGQEILAQSDLGSLRSDVAGEMTPGALAATLADAMKPITVGPALLSYLDPKARGRFINDWTSAVPAGRYLDRMQ